MEDFKNLRPPPSRPELAKLRRFPNYEGNLSRANKRQAPPPSFEFKLFIQLERDPHKLNRNEIVAISGEVCVSVQLPICIIVPQLRFLAECPKFPNYHNCA